MKNKTLVFDLQGTLVSRMRPPLLNGNLEILEKLVTDNCQLFLYTGASFSETKNILQKLKLGKLFPTPKIIAKNTLYYSSKTTPSTLVKIKQMSVFPVIYIGDTLKDYRCSQMAQVKFIYFGKRKYGLAQIKTIDQLLNVKI
jgi:phosphoglycolate phosphatase-like HAD superfamily hydrolase